MNINIKLVKSLNKCNKKQLATARSLGFKKLNNIVSMPDNEPTRGKIASIPHLVKIVT